MQPLKHPSLLIKCWYTLNCCRHFRSGAAAILDRCCTLMQMFFISLEWVEWRKIPFFFHLYIHTRKPCICHFSIFKYLILSHYSMVGGDDRNEWLVKNISKCLSWDSGSVTLYLGKDYYCVDCFVLGFLLLKPLKGKEMVVMQVMGIDGPRSLQKTVCPNFSSSLLYNMLRNSK